MPQFTISFCGLLFFVQNFLYFKTVIERFHSASMGLTVGLNPRKSRKKIQGREGGGELHPTKELQIRGFELSNEIYNCRPVIVTEEVGKTIAKMWHIGKHYRSLNAIKSFPLLSTCPFVLDMTIWEMWLNRKSGNRILCLCCQTRCGLQCTP